MQHRIENPAVTVPGALKALQDVANATRQADISETTLQLVQLRASQVTGCGVCVEMHTRELANLGDSDARIHTVAAWRDVDSTDPVPDDVWDEVARHYDESQLAALVLAVAGMGDSVDHASSQEAGSLTP